MQSIYKFNSLDGKMNVTRATLEKLLKLAEKERVTLVQTRVVKILKAYPNNTHFDIVLQSLVEPFGLNGARHKGFGKIGLDECGRLQPGFIFDGAGNVVPAIGQTKTRPPRKCNTSCKEDGPVPKTAKSKGQITKKTTNAPAPKKPSNKSPKSVVENKKVDAPAPTKRKATTNYGKKRKRVKVEKVIESKNETIYNLIVYGKLKGEKVYKAMNISKGTQVKNLLYATLIKSNRKDELITALSKDDDFEFQIRVAGTNKVIYDSKKVDKPAPPKIKATSNKIVGYLLKDSISGETIASKKTLDELKKIYLSLDQNEIGKGTEIFVYEINLVAGKNKQGKRILVDWKKPTPPTNENNGNNGGKKPNTKFSQNVQAKKQNLERQIATKNYYTKELKRAKDNFKETKNEHFKNEISRIETELAKAEKSIKGYEKDIEINEKKHLEAIENNNDNKKKNTSVKTADVFNYPVGQIFTDTKRFQNRSKLNETVLKQIVDNYNIDKLDPVLIWKDPKAKKSFLLAGHHRLEATKLKGLKTIQAKYFKGTETEAIHYAKVESNANRSLELPQERAKIYRELHGLVAKTNILDNARKLEGKNASYIVNLSYLQPNGITIAALEQLDGADKQNASLIEKIADWIGDARRNNDELTNAHEKEMFNFLMDKTASERITNKTDFLHKISAITNGLYFDKNEVLNLKRFKNKTEGESVYDAEYNELKSRIETIINNKQSLLDRMKNPANKDFIKPTDKDYNSIVKALHNAIDKYDNDLKATQRKLIELSQKKGSYTNAGSNQVGLFGAKKTNLVPTFESQIEKVIKHLEEKKIKITASNIIKNSLFFNGFTLTNESKIKKYLTKKPTLKQPEINVNSLAYKQQNKANVNHEYYIVPDKQIANFLGKIEKKQKESVAITITGGQGSMKTRFCFQLMNTLAKNYKVGHASIEEHPDSALYEDKIKQYLDKDVLHNISSPEIETLDDIHKLVRENDVIIIDSFSKLQEMNNKIGLDKDFRKAYNGKLFVIIYQQTTDGKMRGGSKSQFDGDVILQIEKQPDYKNNFVFANKNRYQRNNLDDLKFNIFSQKLQTNQPTEVNKLSFKVQ